MKTYTNKIDKGGDINQYSANQVADELQISRSMARKYLNELYKEKYLIKIQSRPVLFFLKKTFEEKYSLKFDIFNFLSLEEFNKYLIDKKKNKYNFDDVIGAYGSLKKIVDKFIFLCYNAT